jgi:hypothetical protein
MSIKRVDTIRIVDAKAQVVDGMCQIEVFELVTAEGLKIVDVHAVLLKALPWCEVEVACHFIDLNVAIQLTAFLLLSRHFLVKP